MARRMVARIGGLTLGILTTLVAGCGSAATTEPAAGTAEPAVVHQVLAISVDGLNTLALRRLGAQELPNFYRLIDEGAHTLNARTDVEKTITLPNHASMMTGRRVDRAHGGHGVTWDLERRGSTVEKAAGHAVASVFNQVHAAGGSTALFSTKPKFDLYERSWPKAIDRFHVNTHQTRLVRQAMRDLVSQRRTFTFLHVSLPDQAGHAYGGMSARYLTAVRQTDAQLGQVLHALDAHPQLEAGLTVILTSDHGFLTGETVHSAATKLQNYRVLFTAWGAGVTAGDLYALNPDYADPGKRRPGYAAARQPVRNGDVANLALSLLGLPAVPGSQFDRAEDLDVS